MTIDSGDGADLLDVWRAKYVLLNSGAGNDSILFDQMGDSTIIAGDGNDTLEINHNDTSNNSENLSIDLGAGNDLITISDGYDGTNNLTISGGTGNDTILNYGGYNALFNYAAGDGNDLIQGFRADSTLSIAGGGGFYSKSGEDIIVRVGSDKITLTGAATLSSVNIVGAEMTDDTDADSDTDTDTDTDADTDTDTDTDSDSDTDSDADADLTTLKIDDKSKSPVSLGSDVETADASSRTKNIQIIGNDRDNSIIGGSKNDTLDGAAGDDILTGGKGNDVFVYTGGRDVITDYSQNGTRGADKISIGGGLTYNDYEVDGSDLILEFGNNNLLTIIDGVGKAITANSNVNYYTAEGVFDFKKKSLTLSKDTNKNFSAAKYSKLITIDASEVNDELLITGNKKANYIVAAKSNSTLNGGKGKDTLIGGEGEDVFIYENKSGNKTIRNYSFEDDDIISLGSGAEISQVTTKRGNVILKVGSNTISVDAEKFSFNEGGTTKTYDDGKLISGDSVTLSSDFKGTFSLLENEDYSHISAELGKKAVNLIGDEDNNSLIGGKGKDSLNGGANNDTLWGGKGNDTLIGGDGADTFVFRTGEGTDVISDYNLEDGDLLQILDKKGKEITKGAIKKYSFDGDDLTLSIKGGGKLILAGVTTAATLNVNGTSLSF